MVLDVDFELYDFAHPERDSDAKMMKCCIILRKL